MQKRLSDFLKRKYRCKLCNREFDSLKALRIHHSRSHFIQEDEDLKIVDQGSHVVIELKLRKSMFNDFMKTVQRSGVDLEHFLEEVLIFGDALFDNNVRGYIAAKIGNMILNGKEKPHYII